MKVAPSDIALAIALVAAGVAIQQYGAYDERSAAVASRRGEATTRLEQVRAAERRLADLRDETKRLESDLSRLRAIVADTLDPDAFLSELTLEAERFGVEVQENGYGEALDEMPQRGELSVVLRGSPSALDSFVARLGKRARITRWKEGDSGEGSRLGTLTFYALPPAPQGVEPVDPGSPRRVWLPPFASRLAAKKSEVDVLEQQLAAKAAVLAEIRRFERDKARLQRLVDVINVLLAPPAKVPDGG